MVVEVYYEIVHVRIYL